MAFASDAAHAGYDCNDGKRKQKEKGEEIDVSFEVSSACIFGGYYPRLVCKA